MMKQIIFALSLALASSVALATDKSAEKWNFDDWDADNDGIVTETEFTKGFGESGLYDSWDENDDGVLSEDEFGSRIYDMWDADDNDDLTEDEWDAGWDDAGDAGWFDI